MFPCHCPKLHIVEHYRYLGINIDKHLSWKLHIGYLQSKLRVAVCYIYRLKSCGFPKKFLYSVYYSFVYSYLIFGITAWGSASSSNILPLEQLHTSRKLLRRVINNVPFDFSSCAIYNTAKVLPIEHLYHFRLLLKYYYDENYRTISNTDERTRSNNSYFSYPFSRTNYGKKRLEVVIPNLLNNLPSDLSDITNYANLKTKLFEYFLAL